MNTRFQPYRQPLWRELTRYLREWRQRALVRRELRMLSDRQCEDIGLKPGYHNDLRKSFWW
jgi:uncharacterized protein YjiS (DUF1127 family)